MKVIVFNVLAALAVSLAPTAVAGPQDGVLCSSNMAYRTGHPGECKGIAVNSHGHGGGWGEKDTDGDGVSNEDDHAPHDPTQR